MPLSAHLGEQHMQQGERTRLISRRNRRLGPRHNERARILRSLLSSRRYHDECLHFLVGKLRSTR